MKRAELSASNPDATLKEFCASIDLRQHRKVTLSTVWRGLQKKEKKTRRASEADPIERASFRRKQRKFSTVRLWVIDEFGIHLALSRIYACSPRGDRVEVVEPFETGGNISVISALTRGEIRIPMMIESAIDGEELGLYVKHCLVPQLQPGDILLRDQVPMHKNPHVRGLVKTARVGVELFPAYSPDFDPIEECISKVKAYLRKYQARSISALQRALQQAFKQITTEDIQAWFRHCGSW